MVETPGRSQNSEQCGEGLPEAPEGANLRAARRLDLRGEVCPYTFVKTKLALEEMAPGDVLRVLVDHEPAVRSVPRATRGSGDAALGVERIAEGLWEIVIEKRAQGR